MLQDWHDRGRPGHQCAIFGQSCRATTTAQGRQACQQQCPSTSWRCDWYVQVRMVHATYAMTETCYYCCSWQYHCLVLTARLFLRILSMQCVSYWGVSIVQVRYQRNSLLLLSCYNCTKFELQHLLDVTIYNSVKGTHMLQG